MKSYLTIKHFDPREFNNLFVGAFLMFGMLFFIVITVYILMTNDFFAKEYSLYCNFDKGLGLRKGAAVQVNGVEVGHVNKVFLANDGTVGLELRIRKLQDKSSRKWTLNPHITSASTVYATRDQNLISGRIIFISHGTGRGSILNPGEYINSIEAQDIETVLSNVLKLIDKLESIAAVADTLIHLSKDPSSSVGALLSSRELYASLMKQLELLNNLNVKANNVVGVIHRDIQPILARTDTIAQQAVSISVKGQQILSQVDTTMNSLSSIISQTDKALHSLNDLMVDSEDKLERADDLIEGLSTFWFIENRLPEYNTIPMLENEPW